MLQKNKPAESAVNNVDFVTATEPLTDALWHAVEIFRRQILLIASVSTIVLACAIIFLIVVTPEYTAHALLIIDAKNAQQKQASNSDLPPIDTGFIDSQVEILRSDNIASAVIKKLKLLEDPKPAEQPGSVADQETNLRRERSAIRSFGQRLTVKRVGLTYIIQISYRSRNADRAAQIANAVTDAYINNQLNSKYDADRRASVWLQERIIELHNQFASAESAVVNFKAKNNIVNTTDNRLLGQQQVSELNTQLVIASAATTEAKARFDRINEILQSGSVNAIVTDTLKSDLVSKLRSQYFELAFKEADWSSRYGTEHLAAVSLRKQMQEIRNAIFDEVKRLAETYKSDLEIATQRQDGLKRDLQLAVSQSQTSDGAQVTLRQLESTAHTYKTLYTNFLQRYTESVQQQSFPISEARLISAATPPSRKSYPDTFLVLSVACILASIFGLGAAWLRDMSDRAFRTREDVEKLLGLNCLTLIPMVVSELNGVKSIPKPAGSMTKRRRPAIATPPGKMPETRSSGTALLEVLSCDGSREIIRDDQSVMWAPIKQPLSIFSEALRSLKLAIDVYSLVQTNCIVGFTSSLPNEGKSTIAAALAQLISFSGARCLLVDCDLRNPTLSRQLAKNAQAGLLEVVTGKYSLDEVLWKDNSTRMEFLPVVVHSRLTNTLDIIASNAVRELFHKLRDRYDYIITDFSPISPVVDVRATAHLVDSYVYVVEWGVTTPDVVRHALNNAPELRDNILGVILNRVDFRLMKNYGAKYKDYYSNKYHDRYGI
jgi:polysaccharide biosynthesis transport protein